MLPFLTLLSSAFPRTQKWPTTPFPERSLVLAPWTVYNRWNCLWKRILSLWALCSCYAFIQTATWGCFCFLFFFYRKYTSSLKNMHYEGLVRFTKTRVMDDIWHWIVLTPVYICFIKIFFFFSRLSEGDWYGRYVCSLIKSWRWNSSNKDD